MGAADRDRGTERVVIEYPDRDADNAYFEDEDGQLELLEPFEWDGLDFRAWVEQMPKADHYRSLWRALLP
jgi:hypothetical protein